MENNKNLPTLSQLHLSPAEAFKNDQFKMLLNAPPSEKWVKKHPMATTKDDQGKTVKASYLPIDKIEFLMDTIFQEWKVEVLREGVMFNSVFVTVRIHYKNPVTGEWSFHDGVGAKDMQKDANTGGLTIDNIKAAAVMMALPSAKSYAIKDACEHLGDLFGRNLNRSNTKSFRGSYDEPEADPEPEGGSGGYPPGPVTQEDITKKNSSYKKKDDEDDIEL